MKYLEIRNTKKATTLGILSAVVLSPLMSAPQSAEAQPPSHAPAHGYRRNQQNRVQTNAETRTRLRGTVVEDRAAHSFVLRTDDGRRVLVQTGNMLANVSNGDRVVVRGAYDGNAFQARRVRVTDDANFDWNDNNDWDDNDSDDNHWDDNDNYNRVTIRGVVTRDLWDNDEFEIRAENGRTYRVNTRRNEPRRISQGDRVEIIGSLSGNVLRAQSVRIISNNNGGWNNGQSGSRTLAGVVTRDLDGNRFEIRTTDGRLVQVITTNEPNRLSRGDRVNLYGRSEGSTFRASNMTLTDANGAYDSGAYGTGVVGSRVNFPGVVSSIQSSTHFTVRGDNGRSYSVQSNDSIPRRVDVGDRVRVQGTVIYGGVVRANDIDIVENYNKSDNRDDDYNNRDGDDIDFKGTVVESQLLGATLTIRADNGREYRVRGQLGANFRRGDRVRVRGEWNGSTITNASITRL